MRRVVALICLAGLGLAGCAGSVLPNARPRLASVQLLNGLCKETESMTVSADASSQQVPRRTYTYGSGDISSCDYTLSDGRRYSCPAPIHPSTDSSTSAAEVANSCRCRRLSSIRIPGAVLKEMAKMDSVAACLGRIGQTAYPSVSYGQDQALLFPWTGLVSGPDVMIALFASPASAARYLRDSADRSQITLRGDVAATIRGHGAMGLAPASYRCAFG